MSDIRETVLEIHLKSLEHNYKYLKSKLKPHVKFLAVVKAYAYGSHAEEIAKYLETLDIDYFAVAYTEEGVSLREAGVKKPILVLHPQSVNFQTLIDYNLEPSIYSFKVLNAFIELTKRSNKKDYPIHLKFNTGLNRLGFEDDDIAELYKIITISSSINVRSLFSHMAASEDANENEFTRQQIDRFGLICKHFEARFGHKPMYHMCNTSGILNYPEAHFDMVRSGIGLYGFGNDEIEDTHFKPVAHLKSIISQIHTISKGETVGYNRAYESHSTERVATIPIGHADGLARIYGKGKGFVFINGKKAPTIGNVCMDMIMVNITNIDCLEGDEVIIFDDKHSVEALAHSAGTIAYELLTAISQRVKRQVIK